MATRKVLAFQILPELVIELLRGNDVTQTDGIPKDANLIDIRYNHMNGIIEFVVESESAKSFEGGELVPFSSLAYVSKQKELENF